MVYALALRLIKLRDAWARPAPPAPARSGLHAEAAAGAAAVAAQSLIRQRDRADGGLSELRQRRGSAVVSQSRHQEADCAGAAAGTCTLPAPIFLKSLSPLDMIT